jgi:hypothetical protein
VALTRHGVAAGVEVVAFARNIVADKEIWLLSDFASFLQVGRLFVTGFGSSRPGFEWSRTELV